VPLAEDSERGKSSCDFVVGRAGAAGALPQGGSRRAAPRANLAAHGRIEVYFETLGTSTAWLLGTKTTRLKG